MYWKRNHSYSIKSIKCIEKETIPTPSALVLQYKRASFLCDYLIDDKFEECPKDYGWDFENNEYEIILNDKDDILYKIPKKMLISCSCQKAECKNCKCKKTAEIDFKCSPITCKKCKCFKREKEGEEENLLLSTQFQDYLNELSSEEESSSEDENDNLTSDGDLSDFDFDLGDNDEWWRNLN